MDSHDSIVCSHWLISAMYARAKNFVSLYNVIYITLKLCFQLQLLGSNGN